MKTRAAVAFAAGKPLEIVDVELGGPQAGEVLIEIKATGVCHTDAFTLSGDDRTKLEKFKKCDCRFDLFHFEKQVNGNQDPDAFIDPGGLLIVLEKLRSLCDGVGLDPQSQMLL